VWLAGGLEQVRQQYQIQGFRRERQFMGVGDHTRATAQRCGGAPRYSVVTQEINAWQADL